jgi:polyribonucleotide nucleotidyltransferase
MQTREYTLEVGGKTMTAVFSDLANQANGSVILKCEDTIVLATAVIGKDGKSNPGFFNLTVEYLEKNYAAGLILGGQYNKREGRPSDEAVLSARIIDRTIRPLFDQHIKNAVQVVVTVLAVGKSDPGVLGVNAASIALATSNIPWHGPVGAAHVGRAKGTTEIKYDNYIPNTGENNYSLDLTVCGAGGKVVMIEAMAYEEGDAEMGAHFDFALEHIAKIENWQKELVAKEGKPKLDFPKPEMPEAVRALFNEKIEPVLAANLFGSDSKKTINESEAAWKELLSENFAEDDVAQNTGKDFFHHRVDELVHEGALKRNARVDGRAMDQVRSLFAKAGGFSPMLHGTGIFYRGETHVLSVLTLGGPETAQLLEGMEIRGTKRFTHHYNFPAYSVGETGRFGGMNRREMGHGFLAEKALIPIIPAKEKFPYTIRLVSESTASNGSTSQASICGSTLALMDGGVPIKAPVAGIAMGLILDEHNDANYKILTDIQGPEDHHGDMDFKVAGTRDGITAIQLDIKVGGIPANILKEALVQAHTARNSIITVIEKEIAQPRADISANAPKILMTTIKQDQIGLVIGSGGKTIKAIKEDTGAEITIEDDGTVYVTGKDGAAEKALAIIQGMTHEWKVGEMVEGVVSKILEIGAIVKLSAYADGLVHISEIAPFRINKVTDVLHEGMLVPVKVVNVDHERDRISLSIKEANPGFIKQPPKAPEAPLPPKQ